MLSRCVTIVAPSAAYVRNPPANANTPPAGLGNLVHFYEAVERLRLDVDQVVPIHDQPAAFEAVRRAVETYKDSQLSFR